ncbi:MAG: hypothetical protein ACK5TH_12785 [Prosthecobacter sp.]|jgi:hypothetical protein
MNRLFLILFCFALASCRSNQAVVRGEPIDTPIGKVYPAIETLEESNRRLELQRMGIEKRKAEFSAQNAKHRVSGHPTFESKSIQLPKSEYFGTDASKLRPVNLGLGMSIRLLLGEQIHVGDNDYTFRTASRYILTVAGQEKARGESLNAQCEEGVGSAQSQIFFNPATGEVLTQDETTGAGAQYRYIAFVPEQVGKERQITPQTKWRTVYVELPDYTVIGSEGPHAGTVYGILNGKVYMEMDGFHYAFPIEEFETTRLEFTVG